MTFAMVSVFKDNGMSSKSNVSELRPVYISGATGSNAGFINGAFHPTGEKGSDGRVIYKMLGGPGVVIEHFGGYWQIKSAQSKGAGICIASVAGFCALEACKWNVWRVADLEGTFFEQPSIKMMTGTVEEAASLGRHMDIESSSSPISPQNSVAHIAGAGCVSSEHVLQFDAFKTFVADVKLAGAGGSFYFEVEVKKIKKCMQFGFCSAGFEILKQNQGVGDVPFSWAVDGDRQLKWRADGSRAFGSKWANGDVIGFALDTRNDEAAIFSVSVNGSFERPNGVVFSDLRAPYFSPAFTGYGLYSFNFGHRPFAHAPPDSDYTSVHAANQVGRFCHPAASTSLFVRSSCTNFVF